MDFIEVLPKFMGKDVILVVVDRLTKYAQFVALSYPFTAPLVPKVFFYNIFKLHGAPVTILFDQGSIFQS